MTLSLLSSLNDMSGNHMPVKIGTDAFKTTGTTGQLVFDSAASPSPSAGDELNLAWGDGDFDITMTVAASPSSDGTEIDEPDGGQSNDDWVQNDLIPALRSNPDLFLYFDVYYSDTNELTIKARENSTYTNLTYSADWGSFVNTDGVADTYAENYRIYLDIFKDNAYDGETFTKLATLDEVPNSDDFALFNISSVLTPELSNYVPARSLSTIDTCTSLFARYFLRYYDKFGDPLAVDYINTSGPNNVYHGGLGYFDASVPNGFKTFLTATDAFYSWQPSTKIIDEDVREFLYYWNAQSNDITCKCTIYYSDATTLNVDLFTKVISVNNEIYCFPVGHNVVGTHMTKDWDYYEIWLHDGTSDLTTKMTYTKDKLTYNQANYFHFESSLGVLESIRCVAPKKSGIKTSKSINTKVLEYDYAVTDGEKSISDAQYSQVFEVSTGWISQQRLEWLVKELIVQRSVVYYDNGTNFVPCIIDTVEQEFNNDQADLFALKFKYRYAIDEKYYSAL